MGWELAAPHAAEKAPDPVDVRTVRSVALRDRKAEISEPASGRFPVTRLLRDTARVRLLRELRFVRRLGLPAV